MNARTKAGIGNRLKRMEGQIAGIRRMIENDRYCIDILTQTTAVVSAMRGVEDLVMQNHLQTCVAQAVKGDDDAQRREKLDEVMGVVSKFRKRG